MRIRAKSYKELIEKGYAKNSYSLGGLFHNHPELRQRFVPFKGNGRAESTAKYSAWDLFGEKQLVIYYDLENTKPIIDLLVQQFLKNNPEPSNNMKGVFTRMLHAYNLHWKGCFHLK